MKIIVVGAGEVGNHITAHLSEEGNDIILIDKDPTRVEEAQGLDAAGARGADMIVAVTDVDEVNIVACLSGKTLGIARRIARVKNVDYYQEGADRSMRQAGVDMMINPDLVAALEIERLVSLPGATDVIDFGNARARMIGLFVSEDAPVLGKPLKEVDSLFGVQPATAVAVVRDGTTLIPDGDTTLQEGDHVFLVGHRGAMPTLMSLLGVYVEPAQNVMIVGAGPISRHLATYLTDHKVQVKLVEVKKGKAERVADELDKVMVLVGDGTDVEFLKSEQIGEMDAFVAASNDEETNIMSCLLARHLGAKKTIAVIRRPNYVPLVPVVGIDAAVSVRLSTAAALMKFCRKGEIISFAQLKENEAEFLELVAHADNRVVKKPLADLNFPKGAIVGTIIRGSQVIIPRGDTQVEDGDRVVVFALPNAVEAVEKMFS
jgi:trk system potassium uptake protein TrkA